MAPNFRSNRRQNRTGYVDHDVFEGIPVRHWRRDYVTVVPPPTQENTTSQNDIWGIELPHGMPKDAHLLPQHSQDLLRAARSGRIYKRPAPVEEEEADAEPILGEKPEKKEDDPRDKGFTAKAWKQIPRHLEEPDIEYLAKRRKGLVAVASKAAAPGPTLTKTTVRRTDAAGNAYVQDVIVPKGQVVEGEVIAQTIIPNPAALDGSAQPTPPKRKGAPPKNKKLKGPGRGRKKKNLAPTSVPEALPVDGLAQSVEGTEGAAGRGAVKRENGTESGSAPPATNEDTEMAEGSMAASDDEGGEDGEEGDEGDDDEGSVSAQDSPSKAPGPFSPAFSDLPHMKEIPNLDSRDADMSDIDDLPGPPLPKLDAMEGKSGSPLKNVALTTSNLTSPVKSPEATQDPFSEIHFPQEASNVPELAASAILDEVMQEEVAETTPSELPLPPPEPTMTEVVSAVEERLEEEEEEEMLLDIVENTNNANIGAPQEPVIPAPAIPAPAIPAPEILANPIAQVEEPTPTVPEPQPEEIPELEPQLAGVSEPVEEAEVPAPMEQLVAQEVVEHPADDEEEEFPDLLGNLEKQLGEPEAPPAPTPGPEVVPEVVPEQIEPEIVAEPEPEPEVAEPVSEEKVEDVKESREPAQGE